MTARKSSSITLMATENTSNFAINTAEATPNRKIEPTVLAVVGLYACLKVSVSQVVS